MTLSPRRPDRSHAHTDPSSCVNPTLHMVMIQNIHLLGAGVQALSYGDRSVLDGLPSLRRCHISLHKPKDRRNLSVFLGDSAFHRQRDSLEELTLRGVGDGIRVHQQRFCVVELRALRCLAFENVGLTDLRSLIPPATSPALPSLSRLGLDRNPGLQLSPLVTAGLLRMPALRTLSMRKQLPKGNIIAVASSGPGDAGAAATEATWSLQSVRCIAELVAAKPAFRICL